jgi:hypothetical protein
LGRAIPYYMLWLATSSILDILNARRYLLAGAAALDHMKAEPDTTFASTLLGLIDARVKGAADRALFGLPALAKTEKPPPA